MTDTQEVTTVSETQDAIVSPNEKKDATTTIDKLPTEILGPIVQYLPYKDRMTVAGVSIRWHTIVDQMLGRKLFIGKPCQFTPDDEERYRHHYVPINTLPKVGVNTCYVGEVVDPTKSMGNVAYYWTKLKESLFGVNLPKFKYPHLVKNIFFDGPLPPKYFDGIVRPSKNLERLDIHLSALSCLNPANMDFPPFSKLETLNIWGHKLTQGLFTTFYSPNQIISNLVVLLEHNIFQTLTNLAMEYPFDLKEEARVTDSLLEFLKKHRQSLKKFKISINLFITEEPNHFESTEDRLWVQKAKSASKLMKLKHIEINITSIYKVRLSKIWIGFLESQTALENCTVMTFRLQPELLYRICEQNFHTIQHLGLTRLILNDDGRLLPIDCTVFENCTCLTSLFLEGMPTGLQTPGIFGISKLPPSLERIEMGCLVMSSIEADVLLTHLPGIKEVLLGDAGHTGDVGVSVETIRQVITDRRIKSISLYGSVNGKFPDDGISNGSPSDPVQITARMYGMLEMKLNDNGYYATIPREPIPEMFMDDID